jgi:hypothetical protein
MLLLAFALLLTAALLGGVLAALHLRTESAPPGPVFCALHGLVGIAGFVALLLALRGPPRGEAMGVGGFGRTAAVLLAAALIMAGPIVLARLCHRHIPALVNGAHATIAVSGIVILAAYTLVG